MPNIVRHCTAVLACLLALRATAGVAPWYFLPNFGEDIRGVERVAAGRFHETIPSVAERLLSPDGGLSPDQREQVRWHEATFPHRGFVDMMPQQKAFGWYAHAFGVPQQFAGMDLLLDLGIIDDADETFVNGRRVGGLGKVPGGSAWQTDRLYRVPASSVNAFGDNLLAVHVWSQWGLGGIVGPPVLSAAIAPADAAWEVAFRAADAPPPEGLNEALGTADAVRICLGDGGMPTPHHASRDGGTPTPHPAEWPENVHYAVYRLPVALRGGDGTPIRFEKSVVLDIGPVFDVAAIYLNNKRIGRLGRFPEKGQPAYTEAAARGRAVVSPDAWRGDGSDVLTVVVYRERGTGGLPGLPGLLLHDPLEDVDAKDIASVTEAFNLLLQCGRFAEAEALLAKAAPRDDTARAWLLSHKSHLAFLQWHDGGRKDDKLLDGVLAPVAEILSKLLAEAPKQSAMQAFCRVLRMAEKDEALRGAVRRHFPAFDGSCTALPDDRVTLGDWQMHYGNRFYVLAAMGQQDWQGPAEKKPMEYSVAVAANHHAAQYWHPASQLEVDDPSALLMHGRYKKALAASPDWQPLEKLFPLSGGKFRRSSWWDDHGEMHPFDDEGPDLRIDLTMDEPVCRLALYMEDHDWKTTAHPRQQSVIIYDQNGDFRNAAWLGKLDDGVYARFLLRDFDKAGLRVCKHRGACVAVSGLFVDYPSNTDAVSERNARSWLGSERANLFKNIVEGEEAMQTERHVAPFMRELSAMDNIKDVRDVIRLLSKADVHPCWMYMAATRGFELCDKAELAQRVFFLQDVMKICTPNVLYPLGDQAVRQWMRHGLYKAAPDVVNYRKRRREVVAEAVRWQKGQEAKKAKEEKRTEDRTDKK